MFNSKLKNEIDVLKSENALLKNKIQNHKNLEVTIENKNKEISSLNNNIDKLKTELKETKDLVRKQIHADILLNALEAIGIINKTQEKEEKDYFLQQKQLYSRLSALQAQTSNYADNQTSINNPFNNLGAALGNIYPFYKWKYI